MFESTVLGWRSGVGPVRGAAAICAGFLILSACQTPPVAPGPATPTAPMAAAPSPPPQATHYTVRPDLSDVRFLVFRAGRLAKLGHNHVIQPKGITGDIYLAADFPRSTFSLVIPVAQVQVDALEARSVEGEEFATSPEAEAIAGTTRNMLGEKVLDAAHYPQIEIRSMRLVGPTWAPDVTMRIRLRGVERDLTVPVAIERADDRITVTAVFTISQTEFGITPLSVLGGGLQVADAVRVRMRLVARKE